MVRDDPLGGVSRRRTLWLTVSAIGLVVFLFFAAGTTYSLLAPGYVFADGELPGEAAILTGSLALAALGLNRLRAWDARLRALAPDFAAWLPARDANNGEGRIDLEAATAGLRRIARRAAALVLAWAALFAGGVVGANAADQAAAGLLATGVRTDGLVLSVEDPVKGTPSMWVRYHSPGASWTEEIVRDSDRVYHVGDTLTVVYDPADPARVRTLGERNENQVLVGFSVMALLVSFVGLPIAVKAAVGWRGRARAAARTGWRIAEASVEPDVFHRRLPEIRVRYRDGTGLVLRCALSFRGPGDLAGQGFRRAWIGGWGRRMVVLFPYGPRKPGPYAMPAYATVPRLSRSPR